jgi:hypothetical protein
MRSSDPSTPGPEEWNLAVLAAVGGAVLYAAVTITEAV